MFNFVHNIIKCFVLLAFMYPHLRQAGYIIVNGAECTYFCLQNLWCYLVPAIVYARLGQHVFHPRAL